MRVETKFNVGNHVFLMRNNKVCNAEITGIRIEFLGWSNNREVKISYHLYGEDIGTWHNEVEMFITKQELLKSL